MYVADSVGGVVHVYNVERSDYDRITVDASSLIGIAVVGERIYLTDSVGGTVLCVDRKGHVQWTRGARDGFVRPTGIAASADLLYVVDTMQHRVVMLGMNDNRVAPWASPASTVFEYRDSLEGIFEPALTAQRPTLWVAVFASRSRGAAGRRSRADRIPRAR